MNVTSALRGTALGAAVLLLAVACGGGSSPSPAAASPTPAVSSGPTSVPPSAVPTAAASASSSLVLPHDDPALEAVLPNEFDGKTLFKISVGPVSSVGNEGAEPIKALADEIGDGTGNFSLAFANDPTAGTFNYFALRVPGAPSAALVEKYAALTVADTRGAEQEQVELAGKTVTHVTAPGNPIGDVWIYAIGDTLYGVQAGSPEQAADLLQLLP